jgi:hypothetical protein
VGKGVYNLDSLMRDLSPTRFDKVPPWLKPRLEDFNDYYDIDENFILEGSDENLNPSIGEGMEQNYANNERLVSYIRDKKGGAFYAAKLTASLSEILKAQRQGGIRPKGINGMSLGNLNILDSSDSDMKYCNSFFRLNFPADLQFLAKGGMFRRSNRNGSVSPDKTGCSPEVLGSSQKSNRDRIISPMKVRKTKKRVNFSGFGMRGAIKQLDDSYPNRVRPNSLFLTQTGNPKS